MALTEQEELELLELEREEAMARMPRETGLAVGREMALPVAAPQPTRLPGQVSSTEAFGRGALAGVTSDFDEELGAAYQTYLEALRRKVESTGAGRAALEALGFGVTPTQTMAGGKVYTPEQEDLTQFYREGREMGRLEKERAQASAPKAYLGGQVVGAVGQAALLSAAGVPVAGLGGAVGMGAAQGLGASEADLTRGELGGAALDTATGAAFGAAGYGLGKALPVVAKKTGEALRPVLEKTGISTAARKIGESLDEAFKKFEAIRNVKATGAIQSDISKYTPERLRRIGETLGEEEIIPFLGSKEEIGKRAVAMQKAAEKTMDEIYSLADKAAKTAGVQKPFDYNALRQAVNALEKTQASADFITNKPLFDSFREIVKRASKKSLNFGQANFEKANFAKVKKAFNMATPSTQVQAAEAIERLWNDQIETQIRQTLDNVAPAEFTDDIMQGLSKAKRNWEASALTEKGRERAARQLGNNPLGLSATVVGAPAAASRLESGLTSATATGLALAAATEFARRRGSAMAGQAARQLRLGFPAARKAVETAARSAPGQTLQKALTQQPALFGKYAQILQQAAQQGEQQLAVTDYTLANQSEEYRKMREELMKAENE